MTNLPVEMLNSAKIWNCPVLLDASTFPRKEKLKQELSQITQHEPHSQSRRLNHSYGSQSKEEDSNLDFCAAVSFDYVRFWDNNSLRFTCRFSLSWWMCSSSRPTWSTRCLPSPGDTRTTAEMHALPAWNVSIYTAGELVYRMRTPSVLSFPVKLACQNGKFPGHLQNEV